MKQKTYLRWGVTITAAACAILVFYDTFFQDGVLFIFIEKLFGILKPVLYGLAMAYLLTPIVDFFDRLLRDRLGAKRAGLMRCLSILVTWLLALGLVYLLFSILIPELVASVSLLFSNLESYYRTIYTWVTQLVEDNPYISERVLTLVRDYYNELVDWVKNTVIPGAQVAIVAVTGGVLSVLVFAKDLLVGIVVSVYILARKETFGLHTRKLLYSLVSAPHYERALRATREADRIFSGFVRGKLLDSLIIGILCFIVCSILKFPYTPIIAVFVGVTNIILHLSALHSCFSGAIPSSCVRSAESSAFSSPKSTARSGMNAPSSSRTVTSAVTSVPRACALSSIYAPVRSAMTAASDCPLTSRYCSSNAARSAERPLRSSASSHGSAVPSGRSIQRMSTSPPEKRASFRTLPSGVS